MQYFSAQVITVEIHNSQMMPKARQAKYVCKVIRYKLMRSRIVRMMGISQTCPPKTVPKVDFFVMLYFQSTSTTKFGWWGRENFIWHLLVYRKGLFPLFPLNNFWDSCHILRNSTYLLMVSDLSHIFWNWFHWNNIMEFKSRLLFKKLICVLF